MLTFHEQSGSLSWEQSPVRLCCNSLKEDTQCLAPTEFCLAVHWSSPVCLSFFFFLIAFSHLCYSHVNLSWALPGLCCCTLKAKPAKIVHNIWANPSHGNVKGSLGDTERSCSFHNLWHFLLVALKRCLWLISGSWGSLRRKPMNKLKEITDVSILLLPRHSRNKNEHRFWVLVW